MNKTLKVRRIILRALKENNGMMAMGDLERVIKSRCILEANEEASEMIRECRKDGFVDNRMRWNRLRMEKSVIMVYLIPKSSRFKKEISCIENFLEKVGGHASFSAVEKALIRKCLLQGNNTRNILRFVSKLPRFSCDRKTEIISLVKA